MSCNSYDSSLPDADDQLISFVLSTASFFAFSIFLILAWRRLLPDKNGVLVFETKEPSAWKLGCWLILIPGIYSIFTILMYGLGSNRDELGKMGQEHSEDDGVAGSSR